MKKAARNSIVLKDDLQLEGPHLDEIVQQWKQSQAANSSWVFMFPNLFNLLNKKHEFIVLNLTVCLISISCRTKLVAKDNSLR